MWEDQKNYEGGRWLITIDKRLRSSCLDSFWLEIMMCLIGEAFGEFGNAGILINDIFVYIIQRDSSRDESSPFIVGPLFFYTSLYDVGFDCQTLS